MKCFVYKRKRIRKTDGKRVQGKTYKGCYKFDDDDSDTIVDLGTTDQVIARKKLTDLVRQVQREREGFSSPANHRETLKAPLMPLVDSWIADLRKKGRVPGYCENMRYTLDVLARECPWRLVSDISAQSFIAWRGTRDSAPKTLNEYLSAARAFLTWLLKQDLIPSNPLASVEKVEERGRTVRNRRVVKDAQFADLLHAAGDEWRCVYAFACFTGLRRGEIGELLWEDISLNEGKLRVRASISKNKRLAVLPLHPDLIRLLSDRFEEQANPSGSSKVFTVPSMYLYRKHLEAAGIPYKDEAGRVFDFHSLRHCFGTRLAAEGIPLSVAMRLMRHSDPKLTAKIYVDQDALPLAESLSRLPGLTANLTPKLDESSPKQSDSVASDTVETLLQLASNESFRRLLSLLGGECENHSLTRTRT